MTIEQRALCASQRCHPANSDRPPRPAMRNSPVCDTCEQRAYEAWRRVATQWHQTTNALTANSSGDSAGRITGGDVNQLTINEHAASDRKKILTDTRYWTHVLIEEGRITKAPAPEDVPKMASLIATHIAHLTRLPNRLQAAGIIQDALDCGRLMRWLTNPQHTRRFRPGIPCVEHTTNDQGKRIECPGEYTAKLGEQMTGLPDLTCTHDATHVLTPAGFRRLGRALNRDGAANLLEALTRPGRITA